MDNSMPVVELLGFFAFILINIAAVLYIFLRRLKKRNYINRMRPERLERGDILTNCYYSLSAADHTEGKIDAARILYPPGAYFTDRDGNEQTVLRTAKRMRSEVSNKRIPTMPANDFIKVVEVIDSSRGTCAAGIVPPLVDNVDDRVALLIVADYLRLPSEERDKIRETLYDLLNAKSEAIVDSEKVSQAIEFVKKIKAKTANYPKLNSAKKRTVAFLAQL